MILADLQIGGQPRKVILHAPKNGFFFVIDRTNGKFISAKNFVEVNWATGYDAKRPAGRGARGAPGRQVARSIPSAVRRPQLASDVVQPADRPRLSAGAEHPAVADGRQGLEAQCQRPGAPNSAMGWNTAMYINAEPPKSKPFGRLIAWDPVQQKEAWRHEHVAPWNGGTLTTAGNLVFQGTADGRFVAYNAKTGAKLWETPTGTGVVAAPATYEVDGKQYVSIAVGWGGVYGLAIAPPSARARAPSTPSPSGHGQGAGVRCLSAGRPAEGREIRSRARQGRHAALREQLRVLPRRARRGSRRQHPEPRLLGRDDPNLDQFVFKGPHLEERHARLHRQADARGIEKIKAFIQGTADAIRPK